MEIITQRLRLIPMTLPFLQALESRAYKEAEAIGGFRIPRAEVLSDHVIALRIKMLLTDPLQTPWLLRAMVPCEEPVMIGDVGFHCKAPDPDLLKYSERGAELGYSVEPEFRRRGFAREAVVALMNWACDQHQVRAFFLSIGPTNEPSLMMARALGFRVIDQREDDIDGPELVLRRDFPNDGPALQA